MVCPPLLFAELPQDGDRVYIMWDLEKKIGEESQIDLNLLHHMQTIWIHHSITWFIAISQSPNWYAVFKYLVLSNQQSKSKYSVYYCRRWINWSTNLFNCKNPLWTPHSKEHVTLKNLVLQILQCLDHSNLPDSPQVIS